jgi:amino acid transporter
VARSPSQILRAANRISHAAFTQGQVAIAQLPPVEVTRMNGEKIFFVFVQTLSIFGTALGAFVIALVLKVMIKRPAKWPPQDEVEKEKWREAKFDILRMGSDLSLVGLSTYLALYEAAQSKAGGLPEYIVKLNAFITIVQVAMLVVITALMSYHDTPNKSWLWGVKVPSYIGGASVILSMAILIAIYA